LVRRATAHDSVKDGAEQEGPAFDVQPDPRVLVLDRQSHCRQPRRLTFSRIRLTPTSDCGSWFRLATESVRLACELLRRVGGAPDCLGVVGVAEGVVPVALMR